MSDTIKNGVTRHKLTPEENKKGAANSIRKKREKKTISEILKKWADGEIKKREETDVVFRYRNIPDELLADHYIYAEYKNDTDYMEDMKKVMMGRSKKASFEETFEYYYKLFDEWRIATNYGFW